MKRHLVSLCFDDGFRQSSIRTAEIFERHGVPANFNVIATGHHDNFIAPDAYQIGVPKGDFGLWRELAERGHEVMPHGWKHENKAEMPFEEARDKVQRCLDVFSSEIPGFDPMAAVYNLPYNAASDDLKAWFPSAIRAYRVGGSGINPLPSPDLVELSSTVFGPRRGNEAHFHQVVDGLLATESGWLIYLYHGLGDEGYGPVTEESLEVMLEKLLLIESVKIVTPAQALVG